MNEAHQRFHDWLIAGADGEPARDLAVHASLCDGCRQSIAALDRLAAVSTGLASMPAEPTGRERSRLVVAGRLMGATAVLFSAAILGVGVSQLIGVSHTNGPVAQASPSPNQGVLGQTATSEPSPTAEATPSLPQETLTPLGTPIPTQPHPAVTPIPRRTPVPTATAVPTATPVPTPAPTAPSAPQAVGAIGGLGSVELTWQPPASDGGDPVVSYNVYRSTASGAEALYQGGVIGTYFQDPSVIALTPYYYVVTAVNGFGESLWSVEASATPS